VSGPPTKWSMLSTTPSTHRFGSICRLASICRLCTISSHRSDGDTTPRSNRSYALCATSMASGTQLPPPSQPLCAPTLRIWRASTAVPSHPYGTAPPVAMQSPAFCIGWNSSTERVLLLTGTLLCKWHSTRPANDLRSGCFTRQRKRERHSSPLVMRNRRAKGEPKAVRHKTPALCHHSEHWPPHDCSGQDRSTLSEFAWISCISDVDRMISCCNLHVLGRF